MVEFVGDGAVGSGDDLFKDGGWSWSEFIILTDVCDGIVFMEVGEGVFHILGGVYFIDVLDVLGADFVDDVGTVGFVAFVMSLWFEEA